MDQSPGRNDWVGWASTLWAVQKNVPWKGDAFFESKRGIRSDRGPEGNRREGSGDQGRLMA